MTVVEIGNFRQLDSHFRGDISVSAQHGHPVRRLDRTDGQRLSRDWQPGVGRV